jgi:hypothetical protein
VDLDVVVVAQLADVAHRLLHVQQVHFRQNLLDRNLKAVFKGG